MHTENFLASFTRYNYDNNYYIRQDIVVFVLYGQTHAYIIVPYESIDQHMRKRDKMCAHAGASRHRALTTSMVDLSGWPSQPRQTVPNLVLCALRTSGAARGAAACQIMMSDADGAKSFREFWRRPAHVLRHARAVQAVAAGNEPGLLARQREHE